MERCKTTSIRNTAGQTRRTASASGLFSPAIGLTSVLPAGSCERWKVMRTGRLRSLPAPLLFWAVQRELGYVTISPPPELKKLLRGERTSRTTTPDAPSPSL